MKVSYKQKLFLYFLVVFVLFAIGIVVFERSREAKFRTEALVERLDAYTDIIHETVGDATPSLTDTLYSQFSTFPKSLRITLIDRHGKVLYDNTIEEASDLDNHAARPEVSLALSQGHGTDIRFSNSNNLEYIYYVKRFTNYFVRVAFPYDIQIQAFLKSDNRFLYFIGGLFVIMLLLINLVAERFGKSIKLLKEFALSAESENIEFPDDELGEIGYKIKENYELLAENRKKISLENEKLLQHVHTSGEGLCFFSADRTVKFYNGLFIQYLNFLTDEPASTPTIIFIESKFNDIISFLSAKKSGDSYYETLINHQGKNFSVRANLFEDQSFEIIINDITRQEKTRRLKQEMTGNIAHELRTPITGIRGYLELILSQSPDEETTKSFIEKAYNQTLVLSELIQDMGLISKIEETPNSFQLEAVNISKLLKSLENDFEHELRAKNICFQAEIDKDVVIKGNHSLLYSIFRNLTDNAIRYAGVDIGIAIKKYNEDNDFYYFSYSDTGIGISEEHHLNRLFERFYRVNEGRTRDSGGSGLGLSIVKNAILFHKGSIAVKNRTGGGLEFLITLPKN